jgi:hypothetical protein
MLVLMQKQESNSLQVTTMFPLIPWRVRGARISSALDLQPYLWPLNTISIVASCRLIITGPLLMRDATPEQTKTLLSFQVNYERLFQLLHVLPDHSGFLFFDEGQQLFEMLDAYKKGNGDRVWTLQLKGGNKWTRELVNDSSAAKTCPWTHLPIAGYTRPEPLEREIKKTPNDGLLNRWQTVFPPPMFPTLGTSMNARFS